MEERPEVSDNEPETEDEDVEREIDKAMTADEAATHHEPVDVPEVRTSFTEEEYNENTDSPPEDHHQQPEEDPEDLESEEE